jgi:Ca-activated chloride channel family protein
VQSIPPVELDSIHITPGIHNIIAVDAPQGYLFLKKPNTNFYNNLKFIVRKAGEMKTLNVQQINLKGKYLIGKYDIEVLSLPRININDVDVKQSYTTSLQIPEPGIVTISLESPGFASIYIEKENKLNWVCNLKENVVQESVSLQPGRYRFVYRARNAKQALYTINKKFKITSGASIRLKCY